MINQAVCLDKPETESYMNTDITEIYKQARLSRDPRFDGKIFIAVKSTGIFCRTICPARLPLEKNVTYFISREEAINAGFRPCLRCKPEFSPCFNELCRHSVLTQKAVALIQSGTMLTSSVEEIASAIFTSPRNLNKAFNKYYGVPLKTFQDMTKALFAKKLLFSSNLSIPEISEACGYSSTSGLYSLNNRFLKIPMRKSISKDTDKINQTISLKIPYLSSYNWNYFLDFQTKRLIENVEEIQGDIYRRSIKVKNITGFFEIKPGPNKFDIILSKSFLPELPTVLKKISLMFDLESNTALIEDRLKKLYPSFIVRSGLHIPGVFSPYEAGIRAICGQQISVAAATKLLNQFVSIFSRQDEYGNHLFPEPEDVTIAGLDKIRIMQSKKNTLFLFSQWCCKNNISSDINDLIKVKGIGKWTIDYIKLRALNDPDIWMGTDLGIKKVLEKHEPLNIDMASPWKSYLSIHLWSNL